MGMEEKDILYMKEALREAGSAAAGIFEGIKRFAYGRDGERVWFETSFRAAV